MLSKNGLIPRNGKAPVGRAQRSQDAIALLKADHETVRGLLEQLEKTTARGAKRRVELLGKIAQEIRVHARIEEEIFYPAYHAAAKTEDDSKLFFEATEEHGLVDVVLPALEETDPASEPFGAKGKVLKDLIEHHAEEEETEMFPRAKKLLGKERLAELGEELATRKSELLADEGKRAPRGRAKSALAGRRES
jgi:hemerythrin superfamily protein